ncbi:MAG: HRDC domain-containing protein [Vulcanimicrobiaceae bacterium]
MGSPENSLRSALNELRVILAHFDNKRPHQIINNDLLEAIAKARPETELALLRVRGVSTTFAERYGAEIVKIILREIKPGQPLPGRPYYTSCAGCLNRIAIIHVPDGLAKIYCNACQKDVSLRNRDTRAQLSVKLPTQKAFD